MSGATTNTPPATYLARRTCRCTTSSTDSTTLPPGRLWVHCASGYRASIAASLLDRAGRDVVFIDDSFDSAVAAGLITTTI